MPRGGFRPNAGRPKGTGKFGEQTVPIRVPLSKLEYVQAFIADDLEALDRYWSRVEREGMVSAQPEAVRKSE